MEVDSEEALRFMKAHLDKKVKGIISGDGRWKPWFELPRWSAVTSEYRGNLYNIIIEDQYYKAAVEEATIYFFHGLFFQLLAVISPAIFELTRPH